MREKQRIHKQCVGWAGAKRRPTLFYSKVGLWPSLLLALMMGGCSATNSPWQYNREVAKVAATQADLAMFNEAVALVESQHYEAAVEKFQLVFDRFERVGDHQRAAEALFWIGFCREKQGRLDEARTIYWRFVNEYAGTRAAEEAHKRCLRMPTPPG